MTRVLTEILQGIFRYMISFVILDYIDMISLFDEMMMINQGDPRE